MTAFWLRSFLMLAVLLNALTASSAGVGGDATSGVLMNHEAVAKNNVESANNSIGYLVDHIARDKRHTIAQNNMPKIQLDSTTNLEEATNYLRGASQHRRTQDIDDMLNDMASRDPSQWSAAEWLVMILFLSFFGWLGCCLCTMCCCGRGGGSNILGWLCCYEICCRGGSDIDACCDYALQ